jgi:hypothetical protein
MNKGGGGGVDARELPVAFHASEDVIETVSIAKYERF